MKQVQDWAHKQPRIAGAVVALGGTLVVYGSWFLQMHSFKILFIGLVLMFFGAWSILTRRTFHPRDKTPGWWTSGCVVLVAMAFALAWRVYPPSGS